jgi:hypothetical protein
MRLLPILLLIAVTGFGVWLEIRLLHPSPASDVTPMPPTVPAPPKPVSESEKTEARNQARRLTLNAKMEAARESGNITHSPIQLSSLEQVIHDQVESGILLSSLGESLLTENADRDASIRLRVGYIYQPRDGQPFPVITNDEIDQTVRNADNPAGMTLRALGISASGP